jgi:phosphonate transport system substrate-binding protein
MGAFLGICLSGWLAPFAAAQAPVPRQVHVRLGFSRGSFIDMNPRDLEASVLALSQAIARRRNTVLVQESRIYETSSDFEAALKRGEVQVAVIGAWEYAGMDIGPVMEPEFVHSEHGRIMKEYLLLTQKQSRLNGIQDLKGKDLVILQRTSSLLSVPWLDVFLSEQHLGLKETFFRRVEVVQKPAAAVLPVFFGNRQACVVDRATFQTMVEMNPQVSAALQVIATSPSYVNSIVCFSRKGWPSDAIRKEYLDVLHDLHREPEGRQILMMFKVDRLEPFDGGYVDSLKELKTRYQRMMSKQRPSP